VAYVSMMPAIKDLAHYTPFDWSGRVCPEMITRAD